MATLTATARGQITLRRELLQHLGVHPGEAIEVEKLANGEVLLRAATAKRGVESFIGLLAGKTNKVLTIEEMNNVIADGWAGKL